MQVLILGATGFIGGHIAREALARGWNVRALRRRPNAAGAIGDVAGRIEWVQGELPFGAPPGGGSEKGADLRDAMRGCDVVFHAAAAYPRAERDIAGWVRGSVMQMRAVLQAARDANVGRLIYTSSLTTVGLPGQPGRLADERDFYVPGSARSAYYEGKYAMEMEAFRAAAEGLPVVILNPTTVLGPGDIKPTTSELLLYVARRQIPFYFQATINLVDGRDVAAAHVSAAEHAICGQRYILGGHNITLKDGLEIAAHAAGVKPPRREIPLRAVEALVGLGDWMRLPLPDLARTLRFLQPLNSDKAHRELGLHPRPVKETARDTIEWFRENRYL